MDGKKIFALVLTVALAFFFIVPNGLGKTFGLMGTDVNQLAELYGYSAGFMILIGWLELLGGVGLLLPQTRKLAALGLVGVMVGATVTHVRVPAIRAWVFLPVVTAVALMALFKLTAAGGGQPEAAAAPTGD